MLYESVKRHRAGVYRIINLFNGKSYVGSSVHIYNRLHTHMNKLKAKTHSSKHLTSAYHKYGSFLFWFEVLEYCENFTEREQYYIDLLKPEYNKRLQAQNNIGVPVSESAKLKIAETLKQRYREGLKSYDQRHRQKEIIQYSFTGELITVYRNSTEASKAVNAHRDAIRMAANKRERCNGYQWRIKEGTEVLDKIEPLIIRKGEAIILTDILSGTTTNFPSLGECSRFFSVTKKVIKRVRDQGVIYKGRYTINRVLYKDGELLENLEADNQQPSVVEIQ